MPAQAELSADDLSDDLPEAVIAMLEPPAPPAEEPAAAAAEPTPTRKRAAKTPTAKKVATKKVAAKKVPAKKAAAKKAPAKKAAARKPGVKPAPAAPDAGSAGDDVQALRFAPTVEEVAVAPVVEEVAVAPAVESERPAPPVAARPPQRAQDGNGNPRHGTTAQAVLQCLPELAAGKALALNVVVERLRKAQLLGKNSSSLKLFAQLAEQFELLPPDRPSQVRLRR